MEPREWELTSDPCPVFRYADAERRTIEIVETGGVFPVAEAAAYRCPLPGVLPFDAAAARERQRRGALVALDRLDRTGLRAIRAVLSALAGGEAPAGADLEALRGIEAAAVAARGDL